MKSAAKKTQKDKKPRKKASGQATSGKWDEMNRKQRREMMRQMQSEDLSLEVVHPHAALLGSWFGAKPSHDPE